MSSPTDEPETEQELGPTAAPRIDEAAPEGQEPEESAVAEAPDEFGASIEQAKISLEQKLASLGSAFERHIDELETLEENLKQATVELKQHESDQNEIKEFLTQMKANLETLKKLKSQLFERPKEGIYNEIDDLIEKQKMKHTELIEKIGREENGTGLMGKYAEMDRQHQKLQQDAIESLKNEGQKPVEERTGTEHQDLQRQAETLFSELKKLGAEIKTAKFDLKNAEDILQRLQMLKTMGGEDSSQFFDKAIEQADESIQRQEGKKGRTDAEISQKQGEVTELTEKIQDYEKTREEMVAERERTNELLSVVQDIKDLYWKAENDIAGSGYLNAQLGGLDRTIQNAKAGLRSAVHAVRNRLESFRDDALGSLDLSQGTNIALEHEFANRSGEITDALKPLIFAFKTAFDAETTGENYHRILVDDLRKFMLALERTLGPRTTDGERVRILQSTVTAQIERDGKIAAGFDPHELAVINRDLKQEYNDLQHELTDKATQLTTAQDNLAKARLELEALRTSISPSLPSDTFAGMDGQPTASPTGQAEATAIATYGLELGEPTELPAPAEDASAKTIAGLSAEVQRLTEAVREAAERENDAEETLATKTANNEELQRQLSTLRQQSGQMANMLEAVAKAAGFEHGPHVNRRTQATRENLALKALVEQIKSLVALNEGIKTLMKALGIKTSKELIERIVELQNAETARREEKQRPSDWRKKLSQFIKR